MIVDVSSLHETGQDFSKARSRAPQPPSRLLNAACLGHVALPSRGVRQPRYRRRRGEGRYFQEM